MAGYSDTRQLIIDTLMGRPAGTEIQPEDHQAFALALNDYIRSVELVAGSSVPVAFAEPDTVPVQPNNGQAVYLSKVNTGTSSSFNNFVGSDGNPITISSDIDEVKLVTLLWNGSYWTSQATSIGVITNTSDGYLFKGRIPSLSSSPSSVINPCFYLADTAGIYPNFSNLELEIGEIAFFKSLDGIEWQKELILISDFSAFSASLKALKELEGVESMYSFISTKTRIAFYCFNTPQESEFEMMVLCKNPGVNDFTIYETDEEFSSHVEKTHGRIGDWITISKNANKPILYIYNNTVDDLYISPREYTILYRPKGSSSLSAVVSEMSETVENSVSRLNKLFKSSKSLFSIKNKYYSANSGILLENVDVISTPLLLVDKNSTIIYARSFLGGSSYSRYGVCFFDENKNFISSYNSMNSGWYEFVLDSSVIPSGARYVTICTITINAEQLERDYIIYNGDALFVNFFDKIKDIESQINEISGDVYEIVPINIQGTVNSSGKFVPDNASARRTDFIEVLNGYEIKAYDGASSYSSYRAVAFFDEYRNWISNLEFESAGLKSVTLSDENIPNGAKYFIVSTLLSMINESYCKINKQTKSLNLLDIIKNEVEPLIERKEYYDEAQLAVNGRLNQVIKKSSKRRIAIWLDEKDQPNLNEFQIRVTSNIPSITPFFSIYRATAEHTDLVFYKEVRQGNWIDVVKNVDKPVLYLYYPSGADDNVEIQQYTIEYRLNGGNLIDDVNQLKNKYNWSGKKVVCFGDSITEFAGGDSLRYSDHISRITDSVVYNVGVGGTQLRQRTQPVEVFSSDESYPSGKVVFYKEANEEHYRCYKFTSNHSGNWTGNDVQELTSYGSAYANLDIINMVKAACSQDFSIVEAGADFIYTSARDNNVPIVNVLKSIPWDEVDVVTLFAGTNDWNNASGSWGQPNVDSFDVNYTFGAINEIIRLILTTYPHVKLYWFTPIVRWLDWKNGQGTDSNWSDVFEKNNTTLKQFASQIFNEVQKNHIPVCDMYNTLGWNKYNFGNYFPTNDGTHPSKGYSNLAQKIVSFINANKIF
jgi:lysophospholipase L1-like esterase